MNLQEFYENIGGDYEDVMSRLKTEDRVKKYILMFSNSHDYEAMTEALKNGNDKECFATTHTFKGMCLSLSFAKLAKSSSDLCEEYRHGAPTRDVTALINQVVADYKVLSDNIKELMV